MASSETYELSRGLESRRSKARKTSGTESRPRTLAATESGAIVGFATFSPAEDGDRKSIAELNALYVEPGITVEEISYVRSLPR